MSSDMPRTLKTYIVEDNATIRENLVGTLEELTRVSAIGHSETESDARRWLHEHANDWDLTIVDLNTEKAIDAGDFFSKGKNTPFIGHTVKGWSTLTINRGRITYKQNY